MRVAVYLPPHAPAWYRRRGEARIRHSGHEFAGVVRSPAEAVLARETGVADQVWAAPEHIPDLVPWLGVLRPGPWPSRAVTALGLAAVWEAVQERPLRAAAVAVGATAAAGLVAVPLLLAPDRDGDPVAEPPPPVVVPTSPPPPTAPAARPGPRATGPAGPTANPGGGGELPEPQETPDPAGPPRPSPAPAPPPGTGSPPASPPSPSPPSLTPPASPPLDPPEDARCVLRVELLGIRVTVCL